MIARVISDEVVLYGFIDREEGSRVTHCAKLPSQDWNGMTLYGLDWRTEGQRVRLTYLTRDEVCAPIFDVWLPVVRNSTPLRKREQIEILETVRVRGLMEKHRDWEESLVMNAAAQTVSPKAGRTPFAPSEH